MLLVAGADMTLTGSEKVSPLAIACESHHYHVADMLFEACCREIRHNNPKFTSINLGAVFQISQISPYERAKCIGNALAINTILRKLDLSGAIETAGLLEIAKGLDINFTLISLNLSHNSIIGEDAESWGNFFAALTINNWSLIELNLSSNRIGDDAMTALASALSSNCTLTSLNLSNNDITLGGVLILARS